MMSTINWKQRIRSSTRETNTSYMSLEPGFSMYYPPMVQPPFQPKQETPYPHTWLPLPE